MSYEIKQDGKFKFIEEGEGEPLVFAEGDDMFRGIDLSEADLTNANFAYAFLFGADFQRADVRGAYFWRADIRNSDFRGASLQGADLKEAVLRGAHLQDTRYDSETRWPEGFDPLKSVVSHAKR